MLGEMLKSVREREPLIHNITNNVTVNDVANVIYAAGGAPTMADAPEEMAEITAGSTALTINIGTLNPGTIEAMNVAAREATKVNHPIVLDPVGVGASELRMRTARDLVLPEDIHLTAIRGNISEIKSLAGNQSGASGVDALESDAVTDENLAETAAFIKDYAKEIDAVIAVTGSIDIVADANTAYAIRNGDAMMSTITGTGCQLSALVSTFIAANQDEPLKAVAAAVSMMGVAGEIGKTHLPDYAGNASYRTAIIDGVFNMTPELLDEKAKIEEIK